MAKLSEEEAAKLAELQEKAEAPEPEENGGGLSRVLNVSVDLGDPAQVERAISLGFLTAPEAEELEEGDEGDEGEDGPKRRGFFPEGK
jgi:hypothetical protein